jgi:hypothetical protein
LKEYLENVGSIDPSVYQEKTDETLITEDKTIVGAINELFQSANNGKELIASAIGEPLSKDDTFSAMSSDINGLLSTFKTNMMNNGVTVESGDKFKSLIDKIKGLSEGEGNKGILYTKTNISISDTPITFETNSSNYATNQNYQEFLPATVSLDFNPTVYIVNLTLKKQLDSEKYRYYEEFHIYDITEPYDGAVWDYCYVSYGDYYIANDEYVYTSAWNWYDYIKINIENNVVTFPIISSYDYSSGSTLTTFDEVFYSVFYAIGVGEEDTTLRDSLASILQGEGVNVTEEDDMASLIGKVDSEFDRQIVPQGTAVAGDVASGKTFINSTGNVVTGNGKILKTWTTNASNQYTVTGASESTSELKIVINHSLGSKPSNVTLKISALDATSTDRDNNFTGLNFVVSSLYHNSGSACAQLLPAYSGGSYSGYRYMGAYIGDITATSFTIFIGIGYWANRINTVKLTVSSITCYA